MSKRSDALVSEGFIRVDVRPAALPHHVWKAHADIEYDRKLRVVEQAVLRLLAAGVDSVELLKQLLGLQDEPIVPRYVAELIRNGLVGLIGDRLTINMLGKRALQEDSLRRTEQRSITFRHDPYHDELLWEFEGEDEVKDKDIKAGGMHAMPSPERLSHPQVELRLPEIQGLIERDGLPWAKEERQPNGGSPEILRLRAEKCYVAYRQADLEIWHCEATGEFRWVLLLSGAEIPKISEQLLRMEADGQQILPLEDATRFKEGPRAAVLKETLSAVTQLSPPVVLATTDHRPALEQAIQEASRSLIIISPWIRPAAVDHEMLDWFRKGMERNKELHIYIGFGIDDDGHDRKAQRSRTAREQEEAIARLHRVSHEFHGRLRLVKIGNTHEKIVVVDESYAIVTSFNFLSFKPRPGQSIRRETGIRLSDAQQVKALHQRLLELLNPAN